MTTIPEDMIQQYARPDDHERRNYRAVHLETKRLLQPGDAISGGRDPDALTFGSLSAIGNTGTPKVTTYRDGKFYRELYAHVVGVGIVHVTDL